MLGHLKRLWQRSRAPVPLAAPSVASAPPCLCAMCHALHSIAYSWSTIEATDAEQGSACVPLDHPYYLPAGSSPTFSLSHG